MAVVKEERGGRGFRESEIMQTRARRTPGSYCEPFVGYSIVDSD